MKLSTQLLKEHSKTNTQHIVNYIKTNPKAIAELMACYFSSDQLVAQRAAWPVGILGEEMPELFEPYVFDMLKMLEVGNVHNALKRNAARALRFIEIPEKFTGLAVTNCFNLLESSKIPVAVKAHAMYILADIIQEKPELANELKLLIEYQLPDASAGFKSCAKKVLKKLP